MDVIQYKCQSCGGDLQYDPASGKYKCEYCRSEFTQDELDRQTQNKSQANLNGSPVSGDKENQEGKVYNCPSCGATIMTDETTAATFCFYCHNPVVLSGRLAGKMKPDYVIPFRIDKKKATGIFLDWLKKKKYVPDAFYSEDQLEKITGVYFPYLMYTCRIGGHIDAQGYKTRVYRQGGYECTEKEVYQISREGNMEVKHVMRNALKKADRVLAENVLPFETEDMKPFNMSYLSGFFAETKDIDKADVEHEVTTEVRDYAVEQLKSSVSEYSGVQVTNDNTVLEDEKWEYALVPVWTLTYNADGKIYYFSVNGQTGKTIGELPIDKKKLVLVFFLYFIPVLLILLAIMYFLF